MSRNQRSRRQQPDIDDFDEDDEFESSAGANGEALKQLFSDLIGRWHWIALGLILGVLGALYYLSKAPKLYESTSTILVKQQTASVMAKKDQDEEIDLKSTEALNTVAQRIKRPDLLAAVAARKDVRELPGLIATPPNWIPEWAGKWLGKKGGDKPAVVAADGVPKAEILGPKIGDWTTVAVRRNTRLLDITVSHPSPAVSAALANAIANAYNAELSGARAQGRTSSYGILVTQSEETRVRLQGAQNALANYQRVLETLKDLETRETTAMDLGRRYLPMHPKMVAAQSELKNYQQRFLAEFDSVRKAVADHEYWEGNKAEWADTDVDANARLQTARRLLTARASVLESEIQSQTSVFNSLLTRMQETDINQQALESEVEISSLAELPGFPSSPKKPLVLGAGVIGGGGLGLALALLLVRLDSKFHTVAHIERETGLPVLAAVAQIDPQVLAAVAKKKKVDAAAVPAARKRWAPQLVFREGIVDTLYAEMFRVLRASVSLLGDEKKRRITLFSSALPGEGKTMVSCNFALAAAQQGKKTLLIDLDLRKPSVHKAFGLKRDAGSQGITEILAGQASDQAIFTDTGEPNLHIILSGKKAPNPGELLNAEVLNKFLEAAAARYDLIVLDSAPLLAVPDTRLLLPHVDNFCLVVRAEYVPKGAVRRVIALLRHDNQLPSGVVVNGFVEKKRLIGQNYSYGQYGNGGKYGYGSYGTYGSDDKDD
jgi:capsular exopolysaccharide synthesis family protein